MSYCDETRYPAGSCRDEELMQDRKKKSNIDEFADHGHLRNIINSIINSNKPQSACAMEFKHVVFEAHCAKPQYC